MTNPLRNLNHGLPEELVMLRMTCQQFVERELAPIADHLDRDKRDRERPATLTTNQPQQQVLMRESWWRMILVMMRLLSSEMEPSRPV